MADDAERRVRAAAALVAIMLLRKRHLGGANDMVGPVTHRVTAPQSELRQLAHDLALAGVGRGCGVRRDTGVRRIRCDPAKLYRNLPWKLQDFINFTAPAFDRLVAEFAPLLKREGTDISPENQLFFILNKCKTGDSLVEATAKIGVCPATGSAYWIEGTEILYGIALEELEVVPGLAAFLQQFLHEDLKHICGVLDGMNLPINESAATALDDFNKHRGTTVMGCQNLVSLDGQTAYVGGECAGD